MTLARLLFAALAFALALPAAAADLSAPRMGTWGFDLSGRDPATPASKDFFRHANGAYLDGLEIPADRSSFGAFDILRELSSQRMRAVLEKAAADPAPKADRARLAILYRNYMDEARIAELGALPIGPGLEEIRRARTHREIARLMGRSVQGFGGSVFSAAIFDDARNPEAYAAYLGQAGLNLPDRDYYLEPRFERQRAEYRAYAERLLTLAGWADPGASADAILAFETRIATISWTNAQRRDRDRTYNPSTPTDLSRLAPGFPWSDFLEGAGLSRVTRVVLREQEAFPEIARIFAETPLSTLKAYMALSITDEAAPYLAPAFDNANFEFRGKVLTGQPEQQPRWKRAVALVDDRLGEALGRDYVAAYFPPESKALMEGLVADIRAAMRRRIEAVSWMGPETRARALEKMSKFSVMIGYPEVWRDYSGLEMKPGDLFGDVSRGRAWDWNRLVTRLDQPVDRREWSMTPATVNAYYSSTRNVIVFPAGILQPPFFDPKGDMAINYGAIGGVIGHEITHGFDDQGRKSDGDGRLNDWWTPEDAARFKAESAKLGAQYSAFEALPGVFIKGDLTMGENIADLGGILLALDGYRASLKGGPAPVIDGLTGDQRVFYGWAQVWRTKLRDDRARQQLTTGPHSPPHARVNLPVRNIDAFHEAFEVKPGDPMHLPADQRARIW
ncbi:MAG: M13 family metallopeptidase [Phenylobacterium sp.]